ncbi:alpha/beta fold hydrolase [Microvirga terrestris]|uniref:Alpha/beta hydrolase n=1 Tax=Microvirga terrestris TaxID=2791024 RepID=A0ABS0HU53_9HYPH|nr:alpha/beta hydrolase [Microvirga terrestris]MBF9196801.1 alpha/beta hydrolase [Microvirga terrestris]
MSDTYRDLFVSAADGLRLYARDYDPGTSGALPVVCLSGLTRSSEDFHELAMALSRGTSRPRRVLSLDYRGRGRSDWDPDWLNYDIKIELNDALQVLTVAGIEKAVFVGTSRGGLITMALSAARPTVIAGAVLNDIGPVLEAGGLTRIRSYVGRLPTPRTIQEAVHILKQASAAEFPAFTDEQWQALVRVTWREADGQFVLNYDPNLMKTLEAADPEAPLPDLWPLFDGLKPLPVLVIRGEHSDLLSAETVQAMRDRHPGLMAITVPGQGHAPALDGDLVHAIEQFILSLEGLA